MTMTMTFETGKLGSPTGLGIAGFLQWRAIEALGGTANPMACGRRHSSWAPNIRYSFVWSMASKFKTSDAMNFIRRELTQGARHGTGDRETGA